MKKLTILSVLFITFALFFTGCKHTLSTPPQSNDFNATLPARVGIDEFKGKTITTTSYSASVKYVFNDDNTVDYYSYQNNTYSLQSKLEYSYNSESHFLYLAYRGFYRNNILITKIEDYLDNIKQPTDNHTYTNEYIDFLRNTYSTYAKSINKLYYSFNNENNTCSLTPTLEAHLDKTPVSSYFNFYGESSILSNNDTDIDFISPFIRLTPCYFDFSASYSNPNVLQPFFNYIRAYLTNVTDSTADISFTNQVNTNDLNIRVVGKAKLSYTITKTSDIDGTAKIQFSDFDNDIKEYFKNYFMDNFGADYTDNLLEYLQNEKTLDFQNTPEEYTVQTNQE